MVGRLGDIDRDRAAHRLPGAVVMDVTAEAAQELPTSEQLIQSETLVSAHSVPNSNGQFGDDLDLPEFFR